MRVVVAADDFGGSPEVNAAILTAHRQGVLTSASLMVAGDAVDEAVSMARDMPQLAVGLHIVVVDGPATLAPHQIPHLVRSNGHFPSDPLPVGLRYAFSRAARQELAAELHAQFERFAATGLPLAHVDGHHHMHLHPAVFDLLLPLAEAYGARGVRLPRDDLRLALAYSRERAGTKVLSALVFGLLHRRCERKLRGRSLIVADRVYGLMQTGQMHEAYVLELIRQLQVPAAEIYFHPSTASRGGTLGPNPGDLRTLLSPAVRQALAERDISLATYPALGHE
ncbi:MAG: hopanoid biosynthesis-associated protein HpnK [Anaerolineae bacterium]|nr:hopanoid biosynthesis-associated protein HpnK [Anaerolineae bacterium]